MPADRPLPPCRRHLTVTPEPDGARASFRDVVAAYVGLTKPRVIELLLLTTVPVMFFAARGIPPLGLVAATVVGGALSAGSASAYNCVYDRDIDEQMRRTRRRALPRHIVSPVSALVFATVLAVLSTVVLAAVGQLALGRRCRCGPTRSTCSSTRWSSSAAPPRTSSGAGWPAASRR